MFLLLLENLTIHNKVLKGYEKRSFHVFLLTFPSCMTPFTVLSNLSQVSSKLTTLGFKDITITCSLNVQVTLLNKFSLKTKAVFQMDHTTNEQSTNEKSTECATPWQNSMPQLTYFLHYYYESLPVQ